MSGLEYRNGSFVTIPALSWGTLVANCSSISKVPISGGFNGTPLTRVTYTAPVYTLSQSQWVLVLYNGENAAGTFRASVVCVNKPAYLQNTSFGP